MKPPRSEFYYLFYSAADCCYGTGTYAVGVARAKSVTGPVQQQFPSNACRIKWDIIMRVKSPAQIHIAAPHTAASTGISPSPRALREFGITPLPCGRPYEKYAANPILKSNSGDRLGLISVLIPGGCTNERKRGPARTL